VSTWISWAKAAPGVMVEVEDGIDGRAIPWQATVGHAPAWKDERSGAPPRPPPANRPTRPSTAGRRRPRSPA
jgi:hypothetical protein